MANTPEEWLEKSISDGHINYLEFNKFTDLTIIGTGAFGKVFKCEWKDCELMVALKCLKIDTILSLDEKIIKDFIKELKLLRRVSNHPNIISFYGVTKNYDGHYHMVMQYANEGTLREYLKAEFNILPWKNKLRIAREIALGLLFLHDNNIVHRDLHSKNILIHQKQPKIADFGLSKQINETSMMTSDSTTHGMLAYIEPQCFIVPRYKRDKKSDVYSFGIILWEISSGRPPFESFDAFIIFGLAFQGKREEPIEGTPLKYIELYKQCWDMNPDIRPETKLIFNTLNQLANEGLYQFTTDEHLIKDNANSSSPVNSHINSLEIKTSAPLYLSDTINSKTSAQDNCTLEKLRNEAYECLKQCKFLEALGLFEEILKNSKDSPEDKKNASTWDLSGYKFELKNLEELTNVLCKNTTLTSLNLSYKNFRAEEGKALAYALCNNSTLTSLDLDHNKLGSEGGLALAAVLCKNTTLKVLNLSSNELGSVGGKVLADALCKNSTLASLILRDNELGSEEGKALADALCKNTALTSLDLEDNELGSEGGKALADALCKNTTLTSLDLNYNELGSKGGKAFADALCKNITLTSLDLSYNGLGSKGGKALADALCKNSTLTSLDLNYNELGSKGGKALADALCKNITLTSLDLSCNELGLEGGKALADALCKNTTLTSLNLEGNGLGSKGAKALAYALCKNTTLTLLNLDDNKLGLEGGKALSDTLCKNSTLTSLNLNRNELGSEGGKALADSLCKNTTLTSLILSNNRLGSGGGKVLADALCKNSTLASLILCDNELGSEEGKALADALGKNTSLKVLDLTFNELGPGGKALADAFGKNISLKDLYLTI